MPIYEYECLDCGNKLEVIQKFNDRPLEICPECNGRLHKLISHSSFILKGNGWYVTDYVRNDRKKEVTSQDKAIPAQEAKKTTTESNPSAEVAAKH